MKKDLSKSNEEIILLEDVDVNNLEIHNNSLSTILYNELNDLDILTLCEDESNPYLHYEIGDVLEYCGGYYEIFEINGHTGKVKEVLWDDELKCKYYGIQVNRFYWEYGKHKSKLVSKR